MDILLTFNAERDPFSDGKEKKGPLLTLMDHRHDFKRIVIFFTESLANKAKETMKYIHDNYSIEVNLVPLSFKDPTDYSAILDSLRPHLRELNSKTSNKYYISASSGSPQIHACWLLLAASGEINASIIQVRNPAHVTEDQPLLTEINPRSPDFPIILETGNRFCKEGGHWSITYHGKTIRPKNCKGLQHIAHLLACQGKAINSTELMSVDNLPSESIYEEMSNEQIVEHGLTISSMGTAEDILDARAISAYRDKLKDIEEELDDAEERNDIGQFDSLSQQKEALIDQLSKSMGLNGRARKFKTPGEKARQAVSKTVIIALKSIKKEHKELSKHFETSLRLGFKCIYSPSSHVLWNL